MGGGKAPKEWVRKYEEENNQKLFNDKMVEKYIVFDIETTGLSPLSSQITCICARDEDNNIFNQSVEKQYEEDLIESFVKWLYDHFIIDEKTILVSCNGKKFDLPFIFLRDALLGNDLGGLDFIRKFEHFDIQEITSKPIGLNDLAKLFNCELKSGKGEDAIKLYNQEKFQELRDYCMQDVNVTEQVYLKLKEQMRGLNKSK